MTNYDFKNALIGGKAQFDVSWPCLDETNKIRKPNKKNIIDNNKVKFVSTSITILSKGNDSLEFHSNNASGSAVSSRESQLKKEEFPELTNALIWKKQSNAENNHDPISGNNFSSGSSEKSGFKCSFKHPKFKNGVVTIPLLSFVKVPRLKNKVIFKKIKPCENSLCGNKLDKDQPTRRKGKVRLHKKKFESRLKREIILSKNLKKRRIVYNQNILKVKCLLPSIVNYSNDLNISKLESLLSSLKIEENDQEKLNSEKVEETVETSSDNKLLLQNAAKDILHSQVFREYCTNVVSPSLLKSVESLITTLRNFQDRLHAKEPTKSLAKRRYLCGFKESKKFLLANRVKLIIVATNIQLHSDLPSGRVLEEIQSLAEKNKVPLVFAGRGNQIGYWTLKRRRISIVSVLNYEGAEEHFQQVIAKFEECRKTYKSVLDQIELHLSKNGLNEEGVYKHVEEQIREKILSKLSPKAEGENSDDD